mmetsp:Transcript_30589/g.30041  ORF Transcript_30589/g.30041 Transcript_30589/m.30041 type:complete len:131 (-) Transcript_30589:393-785(-)
MFEQTPHQYLQSLKKNSQKIKFEEDKKNLADYELSPSQVALEHNEHQMVVNSRGEMDLLEDMEGASDSFTFFVDEYNDEQIQEIISIFRNDFKPPKNLWIEKNPSAAFNSPDYYADIFQAAIDQFNQQQV